VYFKVGLYTAKCKLKEGCEPLGYFGHFLSWNYQKNLTHLVSVGLLDVLCLLTRYLFVNICLTGLRYEYLLLLLLSLFTESPQASTQIKPC
uniref:Ovule protein n=1 Tax=Mesocestoides corti TaxID=53468 RepID=A0A5K3ERZ8_MESCO